MLLYALTILVSAFLLFQVQPVIAKHHPALVRRVGGRVDHLPAVFSDGAAAGISVRPRAGTATCEPRAQIAGCISCCWR